MPDEPRQHDREAPDGEHGVDGRGQPGGTRRRGGPRGGRLRSGSSAGLLGGLRSTPVPILGFRVRPQQEPSRSRSPNPVPRPTLSPAHRLPWSLRPVPRRGLGGRSRKDQASAAKGILATLEGFEPSISTLKGWRAGPLHHRVWDRRTKLHPARETPSQMHTGGQRRGQEPGRADPFSSGGPRKVPGRKRGALGLANHWLGLRVPVSGRAVHGRSARFQRATGTPRRLAKASSTSSSRCHPTLGYGRDGSGVSLRFRLFASQFSLYFRLCG